MPAAAAVPVVNTATATKIKAAQAAVQELPETALPATDTIPAIAVPVVLKQQVDKVLPATALLLALLAKVVAHGAVAADIPAAAVAAAGMAAAAVPITAAAAAALAMLAQP